MTLTVELLRTIGSPFASADVQAPVDEEQASALHALAFRNKIGLLYLQTLPAQGRLGPLAAEYDKGLNRYAESVVTAAKLSQKLDSVGVEHVVFKFVKPYPHTPSDVDVLLLGSDAEHKEATEMLLSDGYYWIAESPCQVVVYDLRGGYDTIDRRAEGGKGEGMYYIDLYNEVGASHITYVDKARLREYETRVTLDGQQFRTFTPEADLAIVLIHSIFPEQLYTLAEYYLTLHYLAEAGEREVSSLINIVKENRLGLSTRVSLEITAALHESAHGFIPEPLRDLIGELKGGSSKSMPATRDQSEAPYRHSMITLVRVLLEKLPERKFTASALRQVVAMLNPAFAKRMFDELIMRRTRETY